MLHKQLIFVFLLLTFAGFGQVLVDEKFTNSTLKNQILIYEDLSNQLKINDIISQEKTLPFKPIKHESNYIEAQSNNHWFVLELNNTTKDMQRLYFKMSHPFAENYTVYFVEDSNVKNEATFVYAKSFKKGFIKHYSRPTLPFDIKANSKGKIIVKMNCVYNNMIFNFALFNHEKFLAEITFDQHLNFSILGILIAFAILALAFAFISKTKIYLYYSLYLVFMLLYLEAVLGIIYVSFDTKIHLLTGMQASRLYLYLAGVFNILFIIELFEIDLKTNKSIFYFKIILLYILIGILILVTKLDTLNHFTKELYTPMIVLPLTAFSALVFNYKRKPQTSKFYLLSFLPVLLLISYRILTVFEILKTPATIFHFILPTLALEFFILLIGLCKIFVNQLNERNFLKNQIIKNQIEIQDSERRKIASDLHDDLGSTMALLKERIFSETQSIKTQELILKAIADLRTVSSNLLPAEFDFFGFIPSLEKHISELNNHSDLKIVFIVFGEQRKLNTEIELNIYRIINELMHNIKKHSKATEATVQLIYHKDFLYVSVEEENNLQTELQINGTGIGQKTVTSRLEYIKARVLEFGQGKQGYRYVFEVPY